MTLFDKTHIISYNYSILSQLN